MPGKSDRTGIIASNEPAPEPAHRAGLRPESVEVHRDPEGQARVQTVEPMGGTTILTVSALDTQIKAMLRGQPKFDVGEPVRLSAVRGRLHYFDGAGVALSAN